MKNILLVAALIAMSLNVYSQCNSGEVETTIEIHTDNYANEIYWELVPSGNDCGNGTIFSGGNTAVGCNGSGAQANPSGGYANNVEITEGPWCLSDGVSYDIVTIDDWGDGGPSYIVSIEGFAMHEFSTTGGTTTSTFTAELPPSLEVELHEITTPAFIDKGNITLSGEIKNNGATTITSFDVNYSIDNGVAITSNISNLSIEPFQETVIDHPLNWEEYNAGEYNVKLWLSNINGEESDFDITNNEQTKLITLKDRIPNIIPSYFSSSASLEFKIIANSSNQVSMPTDLDFHPNGDLWVINRNT